MNCLLALMRLRVAIHVSVPLHPPTRGPDVLSKGRRIIVYAHIESSCLQDFPLFLRLHIHLLLFFKHRPGRSRPALTRHLVNGKFLNFLSLSSKTLYSVPRISRRAALSPTSFKLEKVITKSGPVSRRNLFHTVKCKSYLVPWLNVVVDPPSVVYLHPRLTGLPYILIYLCSRSMIMTLNTVPPPSRP